MSMSFIPMVLIGTTLYMMRAGGPLGAGGAGGAMGRMSQVRTIGCIQMEDGVFDQ